MEESDDKKCFIDDIDWFDIKSFDKKKLCDKTTEELIYIINSKLEKRISQWVIKNDFNLKTQKIIPIIIELEIFDILDDMIMELENIVDINIERLIYVFIFMMTYIKRLERQWSYDMSYYKNKFHELNTNINLKKS